MCFRRLIARPKDAMLPAARTACGLQPRFSQMFRLPRIAPLAALLVAQAAFTSPAHTQAAPRVEALRFWSFGDVTRIAVQTHGSYRVTWDQAPRPSRVYFDLIGLRPPSSLHRGVQTIRVNDRRIKQIRVAEVSPGRTRLVFDLEGPAEVLSSQLVNPDRLMIEIRPKGSDVPALSARRHSVSRPAVVAALPALSATVPTDSAARVAASTFPSGSTSRGAGRPAGDRLSMDRPLSASRVTTIQTADGLVVQRVYTRPGPVVPQPDPGTAASPGSGASSDRADSFSSDIQAASPAPSPAAIATSKVVGVASPAQRDSAGDRSLVRVFGLKMGKVVIDAGHGGHDTGTIGPDGLMEKDLVLDVALRLGALITQQLGAQVVYTRSDDTFIPLEQRTRIANNEKADLFISVHANSSPEPSASGVETYFFNLTSDKSGLDLATRENATSASAISDLNDLLHKAVLQAKLEESREFAQSVQTSLWTSSLKMDSHSRDRGVRQAPFVVLIGATMPSILAEIGFVSNPHDERMLRRSDERERIAEALFKGVSQYASTLSHLQIARGPE